MANAYDNAKNLLAGIESGSKAYEGINHIPLARNTAAQYAIDEGDEEAAAALRNPNTPLEQVAQGLDVANADRNVALESLVENDFEGILNKTKKDKLAAALSAYQPKKEGNELYEGHVAINNLELYGIKSKLDPEVAEQVVNGMLKEVAEHYKKKYEIDEKKDSDSLKKIKKMKQAFFTNLYVGDGKPDDEDNRIAIKYQSIKKEDIRAFSDNTDTKEKIVNYILATAPEEIPKRVALVKSLVS